MGAKTKLGHGGKVQLDEARFLVEATCGVGRGCECEDRVKSFRISAHILTILASTQMICYHCIYVDICMGTCDPNDVCSLKC